MFLTRLPTPAPKNGRGIFFYYITCLVEIASSVPQFWIFFLRYVAGLAEFAPDVAEF